MAERHETHSSHDHEHGTGCGHTAVRHDGHTDFLHDGCLHHKHGDHVDEHRFEVNDQNPADCVRANNPGHGAEHRHGSTCGHESVPHGDHSDYLVEGRLHHFHDDHCDDHGPIAMV